MKSIANLNNAALSNNLMNNLKGGNTATTVTVTVQLDITTVDASGNTDVLYCDRRRKKVNC